MRRITFIITLLLISLTSIGQSSKLKNLFVSNRLTVGDSLTANTGVFGNSVNIQDTTIAYIAAKKAYFDTTRSNIVLTPKFKASDFIFYSTTGITTIDNTGMMLVSNASITAQKRLHINTSASAITGWCITNGATGSTATDGFHGEISATGVPSLVNKESSAIEFYTNNTTLSLTVNNGGGITIPNANNATVGTTTNGAVIDTLRGLTLYGNASNWMDCKGTDVVRVSGSNIPDWTLFRNGLYGYTYGTAAGNVLDESFSKFQLDHNWDTTKKIIYPHFHLAHNVATVGATDSIYLCYEYSVSNSTNVFPATSTQCRAIKVPTVQYSQFFGSGFSITIPNNTGMSPIVWTRWYRDQANARDNANYPIFITDVDAHYRVNSLGSNNELQK